jgi:hypothetical protein
MFEGRTQEFPDGTTDEEISAALAGEPVRASGRSNNNPNGIPGMPKSAGGFAANVGTSAANYLTGVARAVTRPVETLSNVAGVVEGGLNRAAEWGAKKLGLPGQLSPDEEAQGQKFDALKQYYAQRYGGLSQAGETLYKDPVGAVSDASMLFGGGAQLARVSGLPRIASGMNAASQASNPLVGIPRMVRNAVPSKKLNDIAVSQYQGALKPPPSWFSPKEERVMITTALDEKIPLPFIGTGTSAMEKTRGKIDAINDTVAGTIKEGAAQGNTVDPVMVGSYTSRSLNKFGDQVDDLADVDAIKGVRDRFLERKGGVTPANPAGTPIPVDKAQQLKQGTYQKLRDSYGELSGAAKEAAKDLARGLKEEVYAQFPQLAGLGQKEKALIDLETSLERFAARQGNRDNIGLGTLMAGAGGGAVSGSGKMAIAVGIAKAALDNPGVKSRIAIALRAAARKQRTPAIGRQSVNVAERVNEAVPLQ